MTKTSDFPISIKTRIETLLTAKEIAQLLHMNPEVIRRKLRQGVIRGLKVFSTWRIPENEAIRIIKGEK